MVHLTTKHSTGSTPSTIQNWINAQVDDDGNKIFKGHSSTIWTISSAEQMKELGPDFKRCAVSHLKDNDIDWSTQNLIIIERDSVDRVKSNL